MNEPGRRKFLGVLGVGVGLTVTGFASVPFVQSLQPSENPWVSVSFVAIDLSDIPAGEMRIFTWNKTAIMVINRLKEWTDSVSELEAEIFPEDHPRQQQPQWLIVDGTCTHLGCLSSWTLGREADVLSSEYPFWCNCHGAAYGFAGEVLRGPAQGPLRVPPHYFVDDTTVVIGTDDPAVVPQVPPVTMTGRTQKLPANGY